MIARLKADFPVSYLCDRLGVSRSAFYDWQAHTPTAASRRRDELTAQVITVFAASNNVAGYRKVAAGIRKTGTAVDRKTVAAIMSAHGLLSLAAGRNFRRTKRRQARVKDPSDLLLRQFESLDPGAIMVGDITYVATAEGWLYVATVIDLATRTVLGHATSRRQTADLIVRAMNQARQSGLIAPGSIFHSDHGVQYRSKRFARYCGRHGILRSMGDRMECWDNAVAESFFSKLKSERLDWLTFTSRHAATAEVNNYIEHYNNARLHQGLAYLTPREKLQELQPVAA
ncbi:IS3 family transposase [Salinibacterium sp.]|uniref:IS3 family transposase n=1 Tax=Salinibacterium sp. TaxID=1915057 RepID=UPI00286ABE53|nr:IS3 family transposase [Salinibacterium sp.]